MTDAPQTHGDRSSSAHGPCRSSGSSLDSSYVY